ncbi:glucan endo-1,3-beta-glucosidase 6-like [Chenopodium quinoa]|uniref:glucan endo-1,3-beta-glucosidase 6-like n=1 Tax=Chenopodium quinoa TaxID=63459 RepID=UPI000B797054|nr:glucan endo-1,3-beta-glucosidase 6-like [Chenopodium quinoa]
MGSHESHGCLLFFIIGACLVAGGLGMGVNWGMISTHPLPPEIVVKLLKDNGFNKVKLFEANHGALRALGNSGIEVMVGIPNNMLASLAGNVQAAVNWVNQNISTYVSNSGVNIRYVAVGNEPFLKDYGDQFTHTTLPALQNIQAALIKAGLAHKVKATVPLNADVYQSDTTLPSGGSFRADIHDLMISIVKFLSNNAAPIMVNIYPFLSLNSDPNFPMDFAFFEGGSHPIVDGPVTYTNVFDANYDTLIAALEKSGFPNMPIIIGEVGWPTDGAPNANIANAKKFNQGLISRIIQGKGTPKRHTPPDVYIFSLIDEDAKSVDPGNFERHWGMFNYDGSLKYQLNIGRGKTLVPAKGVKYLPKKWCVMSPQASPSPSTIASSISYACQFADCTSLAYGSSCGNLDARSNASYVFNMYYQTKNQSAGACNFNNMAMTTTTDPSQRGCRFEIMIDITKTPKNGSPTPSSSSSRLLKAVSMISVMVALTISFAS